MTMIRALLLASIKRLGPKAFGLMIEADLRTRTNRKFSSTGQIYTLLKDLREARLVSTRMSGPGEFPGGPTRPIYKLTPLGRQELAKATKQLRESIMADLQALEATIPKR